MKYSLKHLFVFMLFVPVLFGGRLIYLNIWDRHCQRLEPSLFKYILQNEPNLLGHEDAIYLASGIPQDSKWTKVEPEFFKAIGIDEIRPLDDSKEINVFYVGNINWIDWRTVVVDFGLIHTTGQGYGFEKAKYRLVNGNWSRVENGTEWITTDDGCFDYLESEFRGRSDLTESSIDPLGHGSVTN